MDAGGIIADFLALLNYAQERYATAQAEEQDANNETQDILHSLEFQWHDTRRAAGLTRRLSEIRRKRRLAKDDMEIAALILDFRDKNIGVLKALRRLQGDIRITEQNFERRSYRFRTNIMEEYLREDVKNALTDAANISQSDKES